MNPFSVQKGEFGLSSFIQYECNIQNVSLKKNIKKIAFAFSISVSPNILDTRHFSAITFTDMHQDRTKQKAVQGCTLALEICFLSLDNTYGSYGRDRHVLA